jgi:starch synthase
MKKYEDVIKTFVKKYPNKIFIKTKFDEEFAHRIYAGSDIFLMPSHFEPCGLGQMIAMTYGSLPIVRGVGGLKDTVIPVEKRKATGFVFNKNSPEALWTEIKKALRLFKDKNLWSDIQKNGMMKDFSWKRSVLRYIKLYDKVN